VREILAKRLGLEPSGPILLLNPNASDLLPLRKWETARFVELGRRLLAEIHYYVWSLPAPRRASLRRNRRGEYRRQSLCQCGRIYHAATIDDALHISRCPGHQRQRPGPFFVIDRCRFGRPLRSGNARAFWSPGFAHTRALAKSGLQSMRQRAHHRFSPCNDNVCMQQIAVESVYNKVNELLRQRDTSSHPLPILS